jgi:hypothetical protein
MDTPAPTTMSFTEKLTNIFVSPGELYEDVRQTPNTMSNWLIPLIIFIVVAVVTNQIMLHNPSLSGQLGSEIKKGFDQAIEQGKMTPEQAEKAYEFASPESKWFRIMQVGGIAIGSPIALLIMALVYWLLGKWGMSGTAPYLKVIEVIGLTFLISTLEVIVTCLLQFLTDSVFASPSLALFVSPLDLHNKVHVALSKINIFTFWNLSVVSIGLSKLFQRDLPKVLVLVFALWILWSILSIVAGIKIG